MGAPCSVGLWDMISLLSGGSLASIGNLSQSADMFYRAVAREKSDIIGIKHEFRITLQKSIEEVGRIALEASLDASTEMAVICSELLERSWPYDGANYAIGKPDAERLSWSLNNLLRTLAAQLNSRVVIVFDSKNSKFALSDEPPFGVEVDDAFPKAAEEISEASKCLAFQRNTACVFHLMRAMELAVGRLSQEIGTGQSADKGWGQILSDIGAAIEKMPKGTNRNQWSESHSHLYHVKQAWRNDTMHPKKTYTDEQAQSVFDAVRSFMMHLATLVGCQG